MARTTSNQVASGASVAAASASPRTRNITQADLFPIRIQNLSDIEGQNNSRVNFLQFPKDRGKYFMTMGMSDYSRKGKNLMEMSLNITDTIILPLPQQMVDNHGVNYEQKELQQLAGSTVGGFSELLGGNGSSAMSTFASGALGVLGSVASAVIGGNFTDAMAAQFGVAPNQFLTVMLKGPQYKKHEFSWKLSPRNEQESEAIRNIILTLNNAVAPGVFGPLFTFPKVFQLSFSPNENLLYKFKPAVIENMSVNYAPSGAPSFYRRTEAPDAVEIRLQFLELEFWLQGQFKGTSIMGGAGGTF